MDETKAPLLVNEDCDRSLNDTLLYTDNSQHSESENDRLGRSCGSGSGIEPKSEEEFDDSTSVTLLKKAPNNFVYTLTFLSAIGGFLFGYDTGVVSGAMLLLSEQFQLNSVWQELIVSVTVGAAAILAFIGGLVNDNFGRKPTILVASFVFTGGAIILGVAQSKIVLIIGRFTLGIGIGLASMTVPMYIAESAPAHLRGRLVTLNNVFITGGQFIAAIVDGVFSFDKKNGWRFMLGLAGIPSLVQFIGFIFMPESPRWLVGKKKFAEANLVLQRIRGTDDVSTEMDEIKASCDESNNMRHENYGPVWLRMLKTPHVRRALMVGCMLQLFQQISGINTVMYYSATIIRMSGVQDKSMAIWLASLTAAVNFVFTFVGLWAVERVGRRPLTLFSLGGTCVSLVVLAIGFQLAHLHSPNVSVFETPQNSTFYNCGNYSICDACIGDSHCGFCYNDTHSLANQGSCLLVSTDNSGQIQTDLSQYGRCSGNNTEHLTYAYDFCPTDVAWMATFGLVLYLVFFAPGMGPMPWTINSEIYPLWARSTGNALATATNWISNLIISMTFLTLTETLTKYGAFYLYSSFAFVGVIFIYICLPETKGKHLEEVENLFRKPLCSRR